MTAHVPRIKFDPHFHYGEALFWIFSNQIIFLFNGKAGQFGNSINMLYGRLQGRQGFFRFIKVDITRIQHPVSHGESWVEPDGFFKMDDCVGVIIVQIDQITTAKIFPTSRLIVGQERADRQIFGVFDVPDRQTEVGFKLTGNLIDDRENIGIAIIMFCDQFAGASFVQISADDKGVFGGCERSTQEIFALNFGGNLAFERHRQPGGIGKTCL